MPTTETASDEMVLAPALDYLQGWYAGDAERLARAVHPELSKRFMRTISPGLSYLEECGASKLIALAASGAGSVVPPLSASARPASSTVLGGPREGRTWRLSGRSGPLAPSTSSK